MSPTIHDGAELPVDSWKKAPRQVVRVNLESWKSAGLTFQLFDPPKERETLTVESQAEGKKGETLRTKKKKERECTVCVIILKIARSGSRTWNLGEDLGDVL